jgi:hypothetical protein
MYPLLERQTLEHSSAALPANQSIIVPRLEPILLN